MIQVEKEKLAGISKFLCEHAEEIYDIATKKLVTHLGTMHEQEKKLQTNKDELITIIIELANNLEESKQGAVVFEQLGEHVTKQFLMHDLTLKEAIDSIIFLKQAVWEKLEQVGLLNTLVVREFYALSSFITTYFDSITSQIALTFHNLSAHTESAERMWNGIERLRREANAAFLADVAKDFSHLNSSDEIMQVVGRRIGEFLQVHYCHFMYIDEARDEILHLDRWNAAGVPRLPDTARLSEQVTDDFFRMVHAGETVVSNNTQTNPITKGKANAEIGALAFITVPFHKDGEWKYLFSVHDIQPRQWRKDEIELVRELADRIFPRLERAHAEERQRESEERFRLMADNIENLAWMAKADGYIYWYNKRWYDYTGTTPQDMEGWGWQSVHDPHELQDVLQRWNASIQTGERFNMVFPLKGADSLFRPFLTRVMPVKDTHGNVLHWFGTNTDISEQIKAAEALRKLSAQQEETLAVLESLLKNAPIGFAFFDTHHRYMRINDSLAEINGFKAEEHIGKTIEELLPENAKMVVPVLEKVMKTKEPILNLEVAGETPKASGVTRYWLTGFYPVFIGKSQNVDFVGAVVIEITDRKKLEQQKDEFIAVASHELRTPVTSIKAYTQLLQKLFRKKGDMQSVELLTKMDGQINKLINLIADLLDVSKMQAGKLQLRLNDFNFDELITEIVDEIQQTTTHHTIRTELTESMMVYGDRDRIGQVITNLLTNAVKYSPQADIVVVETHADKETITLSVQDFGLGIPKEKQAKVFERFYRVEGRTETIYPGLGLGLYISSEIIHRHGGTIWVESGEAKGSTFCFTLPIINPHSIVTAGS